MLKQSKVLVITKVGDPIVSQEGARKGEKYRHINFLEFFTVNTPFGEMLVPEHQARKRENFVVWENSLPDKNGKTTPILLYSAKAAKNTSSPTRENILFGGLETRSIKPVKIESYNFATKQMEEREITSVTLIVLGDTTSPEYPALVRREFEKQDYTIVQEQGATMLEEQRVGPELTI